MSTRHKNSNLVRQMKIGRIRTDMNRVQVEKRWSGPAGVRLTVPANSANLLDRDTHLKEMVQELCGEGKVKVCEVGCGYGRVSQLFPPALYIGVDINPDCIKAAKEKNPKRHFKHVKWEDEYPEASTYLFFTVMLHIPDEEIIDVIKRTGNKRVVVCECMTGWLRKYANGDNFQRDPSEYERLFASQGKTCRGFYHLKLGVFPYFINIMVFK